MADPLSDPRFAHLSWDPKFGRVPRRDRKVKIDDRFKGMFTDAKFKAKYNVDKRGKILNQDSTAHLKKYYDLSTSGSETDEKRSPEILQKMEGKKILKIKSTRPKKTAKPILPSEQNLEFDGEKVDEEEEEDDPTDSDTPKLCLDLARGEGNLDSSSDEEGAWQFEEDEDFPTHQWGELDADAPRVENPLSRRLAVCNMDWDKIKAKDLLVLLNSFKPALGNLKSVKIYQSQFGKGRMAEEETRGPKELLELKRRQKTQSSETESEAEQQSCDESDEGFEDEDAENKIKMLEREKIREYQLKRLKYFYAVVECDNPQTANAIYEACDGVEYESSAAKLDLRFIPDHVTFDDEIPTDAVEELGDLNSYKPVYFRNAALQQSKVELTWDRTSDSRKELMKQTFDKNKLDQLNVDEILASASSDEENQGKKSGALKSLVESLLQKETGKESSFFIENHGETFEKSDENSVQSGAEESQDENDEKSVEKSEKSKKSDKGSGTPWQKYLEKRRQKRLQKQLESKKRREKSRKLNFSKGGKFEDLPDGIDLNDPYFREELDKLPADEISSEENEAENQSENEVENEKQRAQLELLLADSKETASKNFSLSKLLKESDVSKKKKTKVRRVRSAEKKLGGDEGASRSEVDFKMNLADQRFSALYQSALFNIDPTEPAFKKTKNMQILVEEKLKRAEQPQKTFVDRATSENQLADVPSKTNAAAELSLLVKSVKSKTSCLQKARKKLSALKR